MMCSVTPQQQHTTVQPSSALPLAAAHLVQLGQLRICVSRQGQDEDQSVMGLRAVAGHPGALAQLRCHRLQQTARVRQGLCQCVCRLLQAAAGCCRLLQGAWVCCHQGTQSLPWWGLNFQLLQAITWAST